MLQLASVAVPFSYCHGILNVIYFLTVCLQFLSLWTGLPIFILRVAPYGLIALSAADFLNIALDNSRAWAREMSDKQVTAAAAAPVKAPAVVAAPVAVSAKSAAAAAAPSANPLK